MTQCDDINQGNHNIKDNPRMLSECLGILLRTFLLLPAMITVSNFTGWVSTSSNDDDDGKHDEDDNEDGLKMITEDGMDYDFGDHDRDHYNLADHASHNLADHDNYDNDDNHDNDYNHDNDKNHDNNDSHDNDDNHNNADAEDLGKRTMTG